MVRVLGGQGVKTPRRHRSNGAKMHISVIAIKSLSINSPFRLFSGGQKKRLRVSNLLACLPLHRINENLNCKKNYNNLKNQKQEEQRNV